MNTEQIILVIKLLGAAIALFGAIFLLALRWHNFRVAKAATLLEAQINLSKFSPQYTNSEISEAVRGYIQPDCSATDPANEVDLISFADVRQNLFDVIDKSITFSKSRRHQLILADSGMGKTSFCLNFFSHFRRVCPNENIALISLAQKDASDRILAVERKSTTVLILDALDEDPRAISNGSGRLYELLDQSSDFRCVIVTCRSQFFVNDAAIPAGTGVSILTPRQAGQSESYSLFRLYISPFSAKQITAYIRSHFPIWSIFSFTKRREANNLVSSIPELAARPMLLELLPMLVKEKRASEELFDLYNFMVDKWLDREKSWISPEKLIAISKRLAVMVHRQQLLGEGDKMTVGQMNAHASFVSVDPEDWVHLTTRSLLNRDSEGNFKFAHRSIMEFLFVCAALEGNSTCFTIRWTDLMRELFISWGYTNEGIANIDSARIILNMNLVATGLLPLSEPPSTAGTVSNPDFERAARRREQGRGNRRSANARWRKDSTRITRFGSFVDVTDLEYNLRWQFNEMIVLEGGHVIQSEKRTVAQAQRDIVRNTIDRLPSYAEFVTLLECLDAAEQSHLISENHFYLLGDQLGERRHLLVSVGQGSNGHALMSLVDKDRVASFTGRKVSVYEVGIYVDAAALQKVKVVPLHVRAAFN